MSIQSGSATVRASQTPRSRYTFEQTVRIRSADADLTSDSATAAAQAGRITTAVAKGSPATFEQRRGTADKLVRGRANVIDYDVANGVVRLSDQVWFSYGGNEFRGDVVVYNIRDERVTVNPDGKRDGSNGRVNITIKPRATDKKAIEAPTPADGSGDGA
jgi:lipopolysaccharide transport protein LptA